MRLRLVLPDYRWGNRATTPTTTIRSNWDLWVFVEINNTCEVLDTILIRYKPDKALDLGNDTLVCKGETLVLKADFGTASYRWQDTSKQATFYVRETGYYWVEAKVGRCIDQDTIHVQFEDTSTHEFSHDTLLCMGTVYNLHPDGAGMNYKWQDSSSLPIFPVTQAGHYRACYQLTVVDNRSMKWILHSRNVVVRYICPRLLHRMRMA